LFVNSRIEYKRTVETPLCRPPARRTARAVREAHGTRLGLKRTTLLSRMKKLRITAADVVPAALRFPVAQSAR